VVLDVTERKHADEERAALLEREQQARAEAERANQMKDEFLATLSHELRTPLNAILGWSHLLRDLRLTEQERAKGISIIERNARVQIQLIEDLLDMSRIISGKLWLDVQCVELAAIIEETVESVRPAAAAKQIELQALLEPHSGSVNGDPNRLQQILWNLLNNAIKFTPAKGRVQVTLKRSSSPQHITPCAEISVADTGQGITADFLPYVFDRFRQQDGSSTRRFGGLGLGLGIVRHLVQLHGGTVQAHSPGAGQGATFTVSLPLAAVPSSDTVTPTSSTANEKRLLAKSLTSDKPDPAKREESGPPKLGGLRILVVDDEWDARDLLRKLLIERDAQVVVATSAREALDVMGREKFDVLISDIGMPGEDGYHLIRQMRLLSEAEGGLTPAIALTAYARADERHQALRAGFNLHLAKPVEPAKLIATIVDVAGLKQ
jgi:CheY-like chemotaxis protein